MGNSLKTIAILSIIALVLTIFLSFLPIYFLSSLISLGLGILIYVGYLLISKKENKLLRISVYTLIVLSSIMIFISLISLVGFRGLTGAPLIKGISLLIALFTILLGFGLIGLRENIGSMGLAASILFIIDGVFGSLFVILEQAIGEGIKIFSSIGNLIGLEFVSVTNLAFIISIIIFFIYSKSDKSNYADTKIETEGDTISGGYGKSTIVALIVAVVGAIFEAATGLVTITLMPQAAFIIINTIYLFKSNGKRRKIGIGLGYINLIGVIVISVITFLIVTGILGNLGWYTLCKFCNNGLSGIF